MAEYQAPKLELVGSITDLTLDDGSIIPDDPN